MYARSRSSDSYAEHARACGPSARAVVGRVRGSGRTARPRCSRRPEELEVQRLDEYANRAIADRRTSMKRPGVLIAVWMAVTLEQARAQDALDLFRQALAFDREVNH